MLSSRLFIIEIRLAVQLGQEKGVTTVLTNEQAQRLYYPGTPSYSVNTMEPYKLDKTGTATEVDKKQLWQEMYRTYSARDAEVTMIELINKFGANAVRLLEILPTSIQLNPLSN